MLHLGEEDFRKVNKLTRLAIGDVVSSYYVISKGGELKVKKGWIDFMLSKKK